MFLNEAEGTDVTPTATFPKVSVFVQPQIQVGILSLLCNNTKAVENNAVNY